jgi:hypothetical protein
MNIYWSYNSFPELRDMPEEKRKEIWKACHRKIFCHWQTWFFILIQGLLAVIIIESVKSYFGSFDVVGLILVMIFGGLAGGITYFFTQPVERSDIREYLKSNEKPN